MNLPNGQHTNGFWLRCLFFSTSKQRQCVDCGCKLIWRRGRKRGIVYLLPWNVNRNRSSNAFLHLFPLLSSPFPIWSFIPSSSHCALFYSFSLCSFFYVCILNNDPWRISCCVPSPTDRRRFLTETDNLALERYNMPRTENTHKTVHTEDEIVIKIIIICGILQSDEHILRDIRFGLFLFLSNFLQILFVSFWKFRKVYCAILQLPLLRRRAAQTFSDINTLIVVVCYRRRLTVRIRLRITCPFRLLCPSLWSTLRTFLSISCSNSSITSPFPTRIKLSGRSSCCHLFSPFVPYSCFHFVSFSVATAVAAYVQIIEPFRVLPLIVVGHERSGNTLWWWHEN